MVFRPTRLRSPLRSRTMTLAIALVLFGTAGARLGHARVVERIAAVVNKQIILLSELSERIAPFEAQLARIPDEDTRQRRRNEALKQALDQMVDEKLIQQEASRLQLGVKEEEVEKAVSEVMRRNNLTREQLEAALQQEGKGLSEYKAQILRPQLLRLKVLNVLVRSRVSVGEDEIKALYQQNVRSLGAETKVRARHIFFHIPADMSSSKAAKRLGMARKVLDKLNHGGDFAELVSKYSDDSVTRAEGGDLGLIGRGTLPASIEDVIFRMKKGEIRGPLRSSRGVHIVQVTDREESAARPYDKVREQLRGQLLNEKTEKATRTWLKDVRKRSYVEIKL